MLNEAPASADFAEFDKLGAASAGEVVAAASQPRLPAGENAVVDGSGLALTMKVASTVAAATLPTDGPMTLKAGVGRGRDCRHRVCSSGRQGGHRHRWHGDY